MKLIILLGYLGSGKTTLIKNILKDKQGQKIALLVNDFGQSDVDGIILKKYKKIMQTVTGGSIFCSCKSDKFVEGMVNLAKQKPDLLIVEASGLANPFSLFSHLELIEKQAKTHIDFAGCITLADVCDFEKIMPVCHMLKMQVAFADLIVLNKCDLADKADIARVESILKELNGSAEIVKTKFAQIPTIDGLCVQKDKKIPQNINDISLQRARLTTQTFCDFSALENLCKRLAQRVHRIKGFVNFEGQSFEVQFHNGKFSLQKTEEKTESFLVLLAVGARDFSAFIKNCIDKDANSWQIS